MKLVRHEALKKAFELALDIVAEWPAAQSSVGVKRRITAITEQPFVGQGGDV